MTALIETPEMKKARSFKALAKIAVAEIEKMGDCIVVCGPISTGGHGEAAANIAELKTVARYFRGCGHKVFDNLVFEAKIAELTVAWKKRNPKKGYCTPILDDFYTPVYRTGLIKQAYFTPGWQTSFGATWERETLPQFDVEIIDISEVFLKRILGYFH